MKIIYKIWYKNMYNKYNIKIFSKNNFDFVFILQKAPQTQYFYRILLYNCVLKIIR